LPISTSLTAKTMARHHCIFCRNTHKCLFQNPIPSKRSSTAGPLDVRRIALPVFLGRVSPVLDTCDHLFLLETGDKKQTAHRTVSLKGLSIYERTSEIKKLGIRFIICGAVSESFYNLLREAGIDLRYGIRGEIDEVIQAYRNGKLDQPKFRMPGSD
jgi:predicted Fe-Mo cluster-binding NifX family protein